jgi:hypothetical protein
MIGLVLRTGFCAAPTRAESGVGLVHVDVHGGAGSRTVVGLDGLQNGFMLRNG